MMSENSTEYQVRGFLESEGFNVQRIKSTQKEKRADYRVNDENDIYITEVKGRIEDLQYRKNLMKYGFGVRTVYIGRNNSISKEVKEAAGQLRATPEDSKAFRVIALVAEGDDPEDQVVQFQSTLYGLVNLLLPAEDGSAVATPCFYFSFNEFFRIRDVDAALILIPTIGSHIYLNSFSPRRYELIHTRLWQLHAREGAICDPEQMERRGEVFVADCDLDRHNESGLRNYIRQKYGLEHLPQHLPIVFNPKKVTAAVMWRIP